MSLDKNKIERILTQKKFVVRGGESWTRNTNIN